MSYRNRLLLMFISFGLSVIVLIGLFSVVVIGKKYEDNSMSAAGALYKYKHEMFQVHLEQIKNKLFAVKDSNLFLEFVRRGDAASLKKAEDLFLGIANSDSNIMQLRYLDSEGMEQIRVDRKQPQSMPSLLPKKQLQNKKHRYYVSETLKKPFNEVWFSPIDLNIEHQQIEKPIKPVFRASVPYIDEGRVKGMVIVNVFMNDFLERLVSSDVYDIYLIDKDDNILVSSDLRHNWSKYIPENSFKEGAFHVGDFKLKEPFYTKTLDLDNNQGLKFVFKPREIEFMKLVKNESGYLLLLLLSVAALSIPLAYLFSKYPARLEKDIQDHNDYLQIRIANAVEQYQEKEKMLLHQHRLAQMGEAISMIAHQWRQPLATIMSIVGGLRLKLQLHGACDPKIFDNGLLAIEDHTQNLSDIITSFKDFYSPDSLLSTVSLDALTESSLQIVSAQFNEKAIAVTKDLNAKKMCDVHANHLKQAIVAILQNAQEAYSAYEGENKRIEIRTYMDEETPVLEISDHAGGIPEEIIEEIFTPYFSTKKAKNGTGLGLYMAKMIIEKHCNGSLSVHNSLDGAVFTIRIDNRP